MYVAHIGSTYILKRMPGSGALHAQDCHSHQTRWQSTTTDASRSPIQQTPVFRKHSANDIHALHCTHRERQLLEELQLLWQQAGLNYWRPAFEGKRHWITVRARLLRAAAKVWPNQALYIPEQFVPELRHEIAQRRKQLWSNPAANGQSGPGLLRTIAEIKDVDPKRAHIVLKHLPDLTFSISRRQAQQILERTKLASPTLMSHQILIGHLDAEHADPPSFIALAQMAVDTRWVPIPPRHVSPQPSSPVPKVDRDRGC